MITNEQVANLNPGDVVELSGGPFRGSVLRGPIRGDGHGALLLGDGWVIRTWKGVAPSQVDFDLKLISRAPKPVYINSDRTEFVPGDVMRDADSDHALALFIHVSLDDGFWFLDSNGDHYSRHEIPNRLTLLVDGTTQKPV